MEDPRNEFRVWCTATVSRAREGGGTNSRILQVIGRTFAECSCTAENCCEVNETVHDLIRMGSYGEYIAIYGEVHEETKRGYVEYIPRENPTQLRMDLGSLN